MSGQPFDLERSPLWEPVPPLTLEACRAAFDRVGQYTIGMEEELMLLSPGTFDLAPANEIVLAALRHDDRFRRELRAAQVEIVTPICTSAAEACGHLSAARARLLKVTEGAFRIAAAGTHPISTDWGEVSAGHRYRQLEEEYTWSARRSLVCGLHVHVAVGGADRTLAVYNALRSYLPDVAALAANSPFFEGEDTELCSIRPKLTQSLPRTGVPPAFRSWQEFVDFVAWGHAGGLFPDASFVWWDLRPHPVHGTLELRAADCQTRVEDAGAIAAFVQCLVVWLAERDREGEALRAYPSHWIAENEWRALRYGISGELVDLQTGRREAARERIAALVDRLEPAARLLRCEDELAGVRVLLAGNGADRQRYVAEREGVEGLLAWLVRETERGERPAGLTRQTFRGD